VTQLKSRPECGNAPVPSTKAGRSCVLGVPAELALLHPIQNALG